MGFVMRQLSNSERGRNVFAAARRLHPSPSGIAKKPGVDVPSVHMLNRREEILFNAEIEF
jgi:hypothetical protein